MDQSLDSKPGAYYVTAMDGAKVFPILGPFINNHAGALFMVDEARRAACEIDGRGCFMAWGTCRTDNAWAWGAGKLNKQLLPALSRRAGL